MGQRRVMPAGHESEGDLQRPAGENTGGGLGEYVRAWSPRESGTVSKSNAP